MTKNHISRGVALRVPSAVRRLLRRANSPGSNISRLSPESAPLLGHATRPGSLVLKQGPTRGACPESGLMAQTRPALRYERPSQEPSSRRRPQRKGIGVKYLRSLCLAFSMCEILTRFHSWMELYEGEPGEKAMEFMGKAIESVKG